MYYQGTVSEWPSLTSSVLRCPIDLLPLPYAVSLHPPGLVCGDWAFFCTLQTSSVYGSCAAELFTILCPAVEWLNENIYRSCLLSLEEHPYLCSRPEDITCLPTDCWLAYCFPHLTWVTILGTVVDATGSHASPGKEYSMPLLFKTNEDIEVVNTTTNHTDNIFRLSQTVSRNQVKHK